ISNLGIPFTLDITSAGTGSGTVVFSTYETATDMNTPVPTMVTHMLDAATGLTNNSLWAAGRFWMIDPFNDTTRLDGSMTFAYVNNISELRISNLLIESDLAALRFNSTTRAWNGTPSLSSLFFGFGTVNTGPRSRGPFAV